MCNFNHKQLIIFIYYFQSTILVNSLMEVRTMSATCEPICAMARFSSMRCCSLAGMMIVLLAMAQS